MSPTARTPKYSRFVLTGALLGAVVGVAAALAHGGDRLSQGIAYVGCFVALLGGLLAGFVAILLDRPDPAEVAKPGPATPPEQRAPSAP